jgi:hypothetical protein
MRSYMLGYKRERERERESTLCGVSSKKVLRLRLLYYVTRTQRDMNNIQGNHMYADVLSFFVVFFVRCSSSLL